MPMDATILKAAILAEFEAQGFGGAANVPSSGSGQGQDPAVTVLSKLADAIATAVIFHIQTFATVVAITPGPSTTTIL